MSQTLSSADQKLFLCHHPSHHLWLLYWKGDSHLKQPWFSDCSPAYSEPPPFFSGTPLTDFRPVSELIVKNVTRKSAIKICELDPLPTSLLIKCLDHLLAYFSAVMNESVLSGSFPQIFKTAIVRPLLWKKNEKKNPWPWNPGKKTIQQSWIYHFLQRSLKTSFFSDFLNSLKIILSPNLIGPLTAQATALKQLFLKL